MVNICCGVNSFNARVDDTPLKYKEVVRTAEKTFSLNIQLRE